MRDMMIKRQSPEELYTIEELSQSPTYGAEYVEIFENFAAHILQGEPLIATLADGLKEVELANSIQLSGWKGEPVPNPCSMEEYNEWLLKKMEAENQ